jgi:hypothetical protein
MTRRRKRGEWRAPEQLDIEQQLARRAPRNQAIAYAPRRKAAKKKS